MSDEFRVEHGSANSHVFDDAIYLEGADECVAFSNEPWTSRILAALRQSPPLPSIDEVERVARALYDCDEDLVDSNLDAVEPVIAEVLRESFGLRDPFESLHDETQTAYRNRARAAIAALMDAPKGLDDG